MSISKYIQIFQHAAACIDRHGEYNGAEGFDRKFDQIGDIKIIIRDENFDTYIQIFNFAVKVFDACISGKDFELFVYRGGTWRSELKAFTKIYPPRNPSTISDLSNLNLVDYTS